jgi:hypothetical protein
MTFDLDDKEIKKFNAWKETLTEIPVDVFGKEFQYIFKFRPTGLGVVKIVERELDGASINLTDFSNW